MMAAYYDPLMKGSRVFSALWQSQSGSFSKSGLEMGRPRYGWIFRNSSISLTVLLAVRITPISVAEAGPVHSP